MVGYFLPDRVVRGFTSKVYTELIEKGEIDRWTDEQVRNRVRPHPPPSSTIRRPPSFTLLHFPLFVLQEQHLLEDGTDEEAAAWKRAWLGRVVPSRSAVDLVSDGEEGVKLKGFRDSFGSMSVDSPCQEADRKRYSSSSSIAVSPEFVERKGGGHTYTPPKEGGTEVESMSY